MGNYKGLKVYVRSYEVAKEMYLLTKSFPKEEQMGLISQIKRAATSIPLNIAEGYGKSAGKLELLRFMRMAKGSCAEMEVLLDFAHDFGYVSREVYSQKKQQYEEIGKMLSSLVTTLEGKSN